ncbi:MAG: hypothetical protein Q9223_006928 [Gallowayella weberi]
MRLPKLTLVTKGLLLTSGQLSSTEARQHITDISIEESCESPPRFLQVINDDNCIWLLPLGECESWTGFLAHFYNLDQVVDEEPSDIYVVTYERTTQGPKEWPNIIALAKKEIVRLRVRSRNESSLTNLQPPSTDTNDTVTLTGNTAETMRFNAENAKNQDDKNLTAILNSSKETRRTMKVSRQNFHLFYWLAAISRQPKTNTTEQGVTTASEDSDFEQTADATCFEVDLTEVAMLTSRIELMIETCLGQGTYRAEQRPIECPRRSFKEVQAKLLETQRVRSAGGDTSIPRNDGRRRRQHSSDNDSITRDPSTSHQARSVSKTHRPHRLPCEGVNPDAEGTITIHDQSHRRDFRRKFRKLAEHIQWGPDPKGIELPEDLVDLWRHFVSIFVKGTSRSPRKVLSSEFEKCRDLIRTSQTKILRSLQPERLGSLEAVLPSDIVSLLVSKLSKDVTNNSPDIFTTYYDFLRGLEQEVQRRPYSRTHQEALSSFRQEITCILQVLQHQCNVVQQLQQSYDTGDVHMANSFGPRREGLILQECLFVLEDRISNFNSLEQHARDLTSFNLLRIESSKDRQEAAIVVFTVVTIIFLPLSFVTSFFGMNTTDIRDTNYPQWIFWATALPLTIAVVAIALFVAQKMEPVKDLWSRFSEKWDARHEARTGIYRQPTMNYQSMNQLRPMEAPGDSETGFGFRNTSRPPAPLRHPPPPPRSPSVEYSSGSRPAAELEDLERTANLLRLRNR